MRNLAIRLAALSCALLLTACGGGGGGGSAAMTASPVTAGMSGSIAGTTPTPSITVQAAPRATLGGNTALSGSGLVSSPTTALTVGAGTAAPVGTVFPLEQGVMGYNIITNGTAAPADSVGSGGATLTFTGTPSFNGSPYRQYELKIPALGVDTLVRLDRSTVTSNTSSTSSVTSNASFLNYMFAGTWTLGQAGAATPNASNYGAAFITGFQTPITGVPTSGAGVYATSASGLPPTGVVNGDIFYSGDSNIVQVGTIGGGNVNINVNFSNGAVTGSLTNTVATPLGGFGASWNNVSLAGTLSGATLSGTTAATNVGQSGLSFDLSSTGTFDGALYGPNGQELGAVWSLHDPTGQGKTALGVIAAGRAQ